jgi:hypothetical protein
MTMTAAHKARARNSFRKPTIWVGVAIVAFATVSFLYVRHSLSKKGLTDVFSLLDERGYTPNIGFSGVFRPGNVIQVAEQGSGAAVRPLVTPLVVAWADKCFPGQTPRTSEFTLPETQGRSSAGLTIAGDVLARLMPSLKLESNAVVDYTLTLENTRMQTFAKADLSTEFSPACVTALKKAIDSGDKVEWFRVVMEAIVADALTLDVEWKDDTSAEARAQLTGKVTKVLGQTGEAGGQSPNDLGLKVRLTNNDTKKTTISAKGLVIIGYRARPFQPVE